VNLRDEFEVIELSSESVPGMVTVLVKNWQKTGKEDLLEAWKTLRQLRQSLQHDRAAYSADR
jgi:hypothetical protein